MKRVLLLILACLMMGLAGCQTDTVILPEGPKAALLGKTKDEQITLLAAQVVGLTEQVKAEQKARELGQVMASLAASNFKGVLRATDYLVDSFPKEAVIESSKLGLSRLPPDNPAETIKELERVVKLATGQRDEALKSYREATEAAKLDKEAIVAKNAEIAERDKEIVARDETITARAADINRLEQEKLAEQAKHADDIRKALAAKDAEIQRIKDEAASKERAQWVLWTRIAGLGLIVVGVVIMVVFKIVREGAGLAASGVVIGLISIFIDWLTNQPWFPWLCGGILLTTLAAGGYALYRMWQKHELDDKKTRAIQDMIDEATAKGDTKAVEELKAHLTYRMGDKNSYWGKVQSAEVVKLGLIDPKGEAELAAPKS